MANTNFSRKANIEELAPKFKEVFEDSVAKQAMGMFKQILAKQLVPIKLSPIKHSKLYSLLCTPGVRKAFCIRLKMMHLKLVNKPCSFIIESDGTYSSDIFQVPATAKAMGNEFRNLITAAQAEEVDGIIDQHLLLTNSLKFKNKRVAELLNNVKVRSKVESYLSLDMLTIKSINNDEISLCMLSDNS